MITQHEALEFFDELIAIHEDEHIPVKLRYSQMRTLLEKVAVASTKEETVQFSNLFSRVSYICTTYGASRGIHGLRVTANDVLHEDYDPTEEEYIQHFKSLGTFISQNSGMRVPSDISARFPRTGVPVFKPVASQSSEVPETEPAPEVEEQPVEEAEPVIKLIRREGLADPLRVALVRIEGDILICEREESKGEEGFLQVKINEPEINGVFKTAHKYPVGTQLNLLNHRIDEDGVIYPKMIVLEPDYLVDVSSIALCFKDYGTSELNYLMKKFEQIPNTKYIRLGNFANLVVDEMFGRKDDEEVIFNDAFLKDFKANPFEYTACSDIEEAGDFKMYWNNCQQHYSRIKTVLESQFETIGISFETATLEPSFLCERYGVQGRLDILDRKKDGTAKIVELKTGSTPWPEDGKSIKPDHAAQLFLYYQMIGVINELNYHEISDKTQGFIMYSTVDTGTIRFSQPTLMRIQEILELRNRIILNEHLLIEDDTDKTKHLLECIHPSFLIGPTVSPNFKGILEKQINEFTTPIRSLSGVEQEYFLSFVNFIAKEQYQMKLGISDYDNNNGLANLWLNSFDEKRESFEILFDLTIEENKADTEEKTITFQRSENQDSFVNFREGDICILYPRNEDTDTVLTNQIFKCSILALTKEKVTVTFRYKQRNTKFFEDYKYWAIERDCLDTSFQAMYRTLYTFISSEEDKRKLILTTEKPRINTEPVQFYSANLSVEQNRILKNALSTKDYFILNGPPGTGKTSIIVKHLIQELYKEDPERNILLLAYTNRAVDELCETVYAAMTDLVKSGAAEDLDIPDHFFIRIGNELSCAEDFKINLLDNIIHAEEEALEKRGSKLSRDGIKELLARHRIIISTVSSVSGKPDLFKLKNFDIAIVDEASQILEPQINGILTQCSRFILIGDHKQLPAIVLQNPESSKTKNESLHEIGLYDRRNSLFERLYKFCEKNKLAYAHDQLTYQGRMHEEIALYPSHSFYNSTLKVACELTNLPAQIRSKLERQKLPLNLLLPEENDLNKLLSKRRLIFFNSKIYHGDDSKKSNPYEAELVVQIVKAIKELYRFNSKEFIEEKTIGIISPYKNQIARIKDQLEEAGIPNFDKITVDTVERFQGSERDIIIMSFAINNPFQLKNLVSYNEEGTVDRKLNVALTRAKEQLILVGNDSFLSHSLIYYKLIEFIKSRGGYVWNSIDEVLEGKIEFDNLDLDGSVEGKTYSLKQEFIDVFEKLVVEKLKTDSRTTEEMARTKLPYYRVLLGKSNDFIRNNVIEYGMTKFDEVNSLAPEFQPEDKVDLYCFYNMRKHYFSSYSIFESYPEFFIPQFLSTSGRVTFMDFGCGPLTSGLAFNQVFKQRLENLKFNYLGIDISNAMLAKAKEFGKTSLFSNVRNQQFINKFQDRDESLLNEWFTYPNIVILNFSYLFSNLTQEEVRELADQLNKLAREFPLNKYLIIYQNPVERHENFNKFKTLVSAFRFVQVSKSETVSYKNQVQTLYDKTERFTYEILSNAD